MSYKKYRTSNSESTDDNGTAYQLELSIIPNWLCDLNWSIFLRIAINTLILILGLLVVSWQLNWVGQSMVSFFVYWWTNFCIFPRKRGFVAKFFNLVCSVHCRSVLFNLFNLYIFRRLWSLFSSKLEIDIRTYKYFINSKSQIFTAS